MDAHGDSIPDDVYEIKFKPCHWETLALLYGMSLAFGWFREFNYGDILSHARDLGWPRYPRFDLITEANLVYSEGRGNRNVYSLTSYDDEFLGVLRKTIATRLGNKAWKSLLKKTSEWDHEHKNQVTTSQEKFLTA